MKIVDVNEEELKKKAKKGRNKEIENLLLDYMAYGYSCVQVIDEDNFYNNENDLYSSIRSQLKRNEMLKEKIKVFMLNGNVYLKRKDK